MTSHQMPTTLDSIKRNLVALRMPRALEVLDSTFRKEFFGLPSSIRRGILRHGVVSSPALQRRNQQG